MPRKSETKGVSLTPKLRNQATARAESLGLGFSTYVQTLIRRDLLDGGPLWISEHPLTYPAPQVPGGAPPAGQSGQASNPLRKKPSPQQRKGRDSAS